MLKKCYYLGIEGLDAELVRTGIIWLFENSTKNGAWLATLTIENLRRYISYTKFSILEELLNDTHQSVINNIGITVITKDWIPINGDSKVLLAIHPTMEFLEKLDNIPDITKMAVVPFLGSEIEGWRIKHNATEISLMTSSSIPISSSLNETITRALKDLVQIVDLSKPVWESDVKFASINAFMILCKNGYDDYTPDDIHKWLTTNGGWNPLAASQAATIAEQIRSGNKYELFRDKQNLYWKNDVIEKWKGKD